MKLSARAEVPEDVHDRHVQLVAHSHWRLLPAQVNLQVGELVQDDFLKPLGVGEALQVVDKEAALLGPVFAFCCCDPSFTFLEKGSTEVSRPASKLWPPHCWENVILLESVKNKDDNLQI